jgi:hypothetical protein
MCPCDLDEVLYVHDVEALFARKSCLTALSAKNIGVSLSALMSVPSSLFLIRLKAVLHSDASLGV